nr:MAG: RNA replicase beta chain [Guiyang fiers-like virus 3]
MWGVSFQLLIGVSSMSSRVSAEKKVSTDAGSVRPLQTILDSLDTPLSRSISKMLRLGDGKGILSLDYDPSSAPSADRCARDWLAYNLLRKAKWLPGYSDDDRKKACFDGWIEDERLNALTNQRLRVRQTSTSVSGDSLIFEMSRKISALLGELDLDEVAAAIGFSTGSSTRLRRSEGQPHNKLWGKPHVTPSALPYAIALVRSSPSWTALAIEQNGFNPRDWFELTPGGKWFSVPKSAKTERSCEQQPEFNLILQKGVGSVIRRKLKQFAGVDLNDQSINQALALQASATGTLATLDLSSASNSVTVELVRQLLPPSWFDLLDALRCQWVKLDRGWHHLSMFSSMGNGFTFELESMIFWAASAVLVDQLHKDVADRRFSVYGDDIIVPTACAGALVELLNHLGFRVNEEKSFVSGPFRESCGLHAFNGVVVTPFYCRELISKREERIRLANRLRSWCSVGGVCDPTYRRAWSQLAGPVLQYRGTDSFGDSHLHVPFSYGRRRMWMKIGKTRVSNRSPAGVVSWFIRAVPRDVDDLEHWTVSPQGMTVSVSSMSVTVDRNKMVQCIRSSSLDESHASKFTSVNHTIKDVRDSIPVWQCELG